MLFKNSAGKYWCLVGVVLNLLAPALAHLNHAGVIHVEDEHRVLPIILHGGGSVIVLIGVVILFVRKQTS